MNSWENCGEEFSSRLGLELHYAEYHGNKTDTDETSFDLVEELDSDTSELNVDDVVMSGSPRPSSSSPFSAPACSEGSSGKAHKEVICDSL